jgi:outer membrane protein
MSRSFPCIPSRHRFARHRSSPGRSNARTVALTLSLSLAATAAGAQPVPLTVADATAQALQRLPEVAIQRDAVALTAESEVRAAAAYDPVVRLDARLRTRTDPLNTLFVGAPPDALAPRNTSVAGSASWSQLFTSGATVTASASSSAEQTNSRFALLTPAYFTTLGVEIRQPLLAGRRLDAQRRALRVSALDSSRSKAALDRLVSETVAAVERAYWLLRTAREDVRIREQSLTLADAQREETAIRIEAGVAAEAELAAPRAEIARRRADLVRARDEATRADLALRALITGTADAPAWSTAFELTDDPAPPAPVEPVDGLVAAALARRPEAADVEAAREIAEIDTALARERTRLQLDLVAAYNLRGLAGGENRDLFVPFPNTTIVVPDAQRGGLDDSLQTLAAHRFSDVWVGVSVALPIGRRAAKADLVAATLLERRVGLQRDQIAQRIATEVRTAAAALNAARERLDAAAALEVAATELLEAERARFDTGQSTNFFVLTRQTELTQASLALATARLDAARATTELHRATGQLLERRAIQVETTRPAQTPPASPSKGLPR